jgi:hypothetical protein
VKSIAREFHIPVLSAKVASRVPRLIFKIRAIATAPAATLWPMNVSRGIDQALQQLEADDFATSRVVHTGQTGFDIGLDRVTGHHLNKIGGAIHEGLRLLLRSLTVILAITAGFWCFIPSLWPVWLGMIFDSWWPNSSPCGIPAASLASKDEQGRFGLLEPEVKIDTLPLPTTAIA